MTAHGRMELCDLIGRHALVAAKPGEPLLCQFMLWTLAVAMREGHILPHQQKVNLADPAELAGLNDVLEGRPLVIAQNGGEIIKPAPDVSVWWLPATLLVPVMRLVLYQGVMIQNIASMDRYRFIKVGYARRHCGTQHSWSRNAKLAENIRNGMVRIANQVRKLFLGENGEDGQLSITMSTRTLVRWAKLSLIFRGALMLLVCPRSSFC